jgi:hypothetical protein
MADEEALHADRRSPEQIEQLANIMTGIMGSAEESHLWTIKHEKKMARQRKKADEDAKDNFVNRLTGIAQETFRLSSMFPVEEQIRMLQDLYHTYNENNASPEIRQITMERLEHLQELAK